MTLLSQTSVDTTHASMVTKDRTAFQKVNRIAVPLLLAFMAFTLAGFISTSKASANSTACGFQQKASGNILAEDGSGKVLGTLSLWVNTCSNQAYAHLACAITTDFIQNTIVDFKAPKQPYFWSASSACTPGQSVDSPMSTYTATQTCTLGYIGDSYIFEQDNFSNEGTAYVCA